MAGNTASTTPYLNSNQNTGQTSNQGTAPNLLQNPYQASIQNGTTVQGLAKQYGTTVQNIQAQNPQLSGGNLQVGQRLSVGNPAPLGVSQSPALATPPPPPSPHMGVVTANAAAKGTTVPAVGAVKQPIPTTTNQAVPIQPSAASKAGIPSAPAPLNLNNPSAIWQYVQNMGNQQFNSQKTGYQQMIDQYNQQLGQLQTNQAIQQQAQQQANDKYSAALQQLDQSKQDAQTNYQNTLNTLNQNYAQQQNTAHQNNFQQLANENESMNARGLYNSTILDNMRGMINGQMNQQLGQLADKYNTNVQNMNNTLNNLVQKYDQQKQNMTTQQSNDILNTIKTLTNTRDQEASKLNLLITQANQNIANARNSTTANENAQYQQMYNSYQQQQAAKAAQAQSLALEQARLNMEQASQAASQQKAQEAAQALALKNQQAQQAAYNAAHPTLSQFDQAQFNQGLAADKFNYATATPQTLTNEIAKMGAAQKLSTPEMQALYNYGMTQIQAAQKAGATSPTAGATGPITPNSFLTKYLPQDLNAANQNVIQPGLNTVKNFTDWTGINPFLPGQNNPLDSILSYAGVQTPNWMAWL